MPLPTPASPADPGQALENYLRAEQLSLLTRNRGEQFVTIFTTALTAHVVWRLYPAWLLEGWVAVSCGVVCLRAYLANRCHAEALSPPAVRRRTRVFAGFITLIALLWAFPSSALLLTSNLGDQFYVILITSGLMAGGVAANAVCRPAIIGLSIAAELPLIAAILARQDPMNDYFAGLMIAFTALILNAGLKSNRIITDNIRMRFDQDQLLAQVQSSEAAMAEAQRLSKAGSWVLDLETRIITLSPEACRIFGLDPATPAQDLGFLLKHMHRDDQEMATAHMANAIRGVEISGYDQRIVMGSGAIKHIHIAPKTIFDSAGKPIRITGSVQDITARRVTEDRLQFANILLRTQMEASPDGILVVDANRNLVSSNQRFAEMWRLPAEYLVPGADKFSRAHIIAQVAAPEAYEARIEYLVAHPEQVGEDEILTTDGRIFERYSRSMITADGEHLGRVWFFSDVTARRAAEAQTLRLARYDVLTGLVNRAVFVEAVHQAIAHARRDNTTFAVLYLDLDHFKDVNDTLGHPAGDALLKTVAARLLSATRETDTVGRFGGDEFAIILSGIQDASGAGILAEKLIAAINVPLVIGLNTVHVRASIGIEIFSPQAEDSETLLAHADVALYRAKAEGRGTFRFFTAAMDRDVRLRVALGTELREALGENAFFLVYQPQVEAATGRLTGLEALVRWRHPTRGILLPETFIDAAETTGAITQLGHFVLWAVCRQAAAWRDAGLEIPRIGFNVSALQFKGSTALEADIAAALAEFGLPAQMLELELTESVLMGNSPEQDNLLRRLKRRGIKFAIDDFGTGYSSLDYLRRFPTDHMKIAHSFTKNVETEAGDAAIVRAIIGLANELNIATIAEGIETASQLALIASWGCSQMQGFYFANPMPPEDITTLLQSGSLLLPTAKPQNPTTPSWPGLTRPSAPYLLSDH